MLAAGVAVVLAATAPAAADAAQHKALQTATETATSGGELTTESLGGSGVWSAYVSRDQTGRVCYLVGQPKKSDAAGVAGRRQPMAMVTHRPAEHIANVVSFVEGYGLKPGSNVALEIGERRFSLFTQGDSAWAPTSELDRTIVGTLARGTSVVAKGEAENGRTTTDSYSLAGFAKALALIDKACGVTREPVAAPTRHPAAHRHHAAHQAKPHRRRETHKPPPVHKRKAHAAPATPEAAKPPSG
jgi:hypothetical protein